jgi:hypothetical protein
MASILAHGNVIEPDSFYRPSQISYLDLFKSAGNAAMNCWKRAVEASQQEKNNANRTGGNRGNGEFKKSKITITKTITVILSPLFPLLPPVVLPETPSDAGVT